MLPLLHRNTFSSLTTKIPPLLSLLRRQRNQNPAALLKDRHSRSGLVKTETARKNGAGAHNWGSHAQEGEYENSGHADAQGERDEVGPLPVKPSAPGVGVGGGGIEDGGAGTSPSDSFSSIDSVQEGGQGKARRGSNVTEEERERARLYREGAWNKDGIDLAHIAKTSYGIAQSPPGVGFLGTSPTKAKNGFAAKQ